MSTRRNVGVFLAATAAALVIGGPAAAAPAVEPGPASDLLNGLTAAQATEDPEPSPTGGRGRGGYGYGQTTPPGGELPETPPGGELPETPAPVPCCGVSPAHVPGGELPVTGAPVALVVAAGGVLAAAGVALRVSARRRRAR